ncbi:MAG TPA: efflux RND transporter periplasmic adaptor subunit [bacterium]|jgi:RND family efflux transporter MFP subunit
MRKWIVIAAVMLVVAAGAFALQRRGQPQHPAAVAPTQAAVAPAVEVAAVRIGTIERTLDVSGTIASAQDAGVTSKIPGKVAAVRVSEGARVGRGQVLVQLETAELSAQVAQAAQGVRQAMAAYDVAAARLRAVQAGPRAQERAQVNNAVAQAEANLRNAESNVVRMQQLYDSGAVSRQQLEAAILQRDVARSQLDSARQQASLVESGARPEEIQMARAQVAQAAAGVAAARAMLVLARVQYGNATIRAPFAGRIAQVHVAVGEFVAPGIPVVTEYDDTRLDLEAKVGERELAQIIPGGSVTVHAQTAPTATIRGTVRLVQPTVEAASRTAIVLIRLINPPAAVLPGTSARATVLVERRTGVLLVPAAALRSDGATMVFVVSGGVAHARPVTLGLRQGDLVQVRSGVASGEQVIVLGPETITDGMRVTVVNR